MNENTKEPDKAKNHYCAIPTAFLGKIKNPHCYPILGYFLYRSMINFKLHLSDMAVELNLTKRQLLPAIEELKSLGLVKVFGKVGAQFYLLDDAAYKKALLEPYQQKNKRKTSDTNVTSNKKELPKTSNENVTGTNNVTGSGDKNVTATSDKNVTVKNTEERSQKKDYNLIDNNSEIVGKTDLDKILSPLQPSVGTFDGSNGSLNLNSSGSLQLPPLAALNVSGENSISASIQLAVGNRENPSGESVTGNYLQSSPVAKPKTLQKTSTRGFRGELPECVQRHYDLAIWTWTKSPARWTPESIQNMIQELDKRIHNFDYTNFDQNLDRDLVRRNVSDIQDKFGIYSFLPATTGSAANLQKN